MITPGWFYKLVSLCHVLKTRVNLELDLMQCVFRSILIVDCQKMTLSIESCRRPASVERITLLGSSSLTAALLKRDMSYSNNAIGWILMKHIQGN